MAHFKVPRKIFKIRKLKRPRMASSNKVELLYIISNKEFEDILHDVFMLKSTYELLIQFDHNAALDEVVPNEFEELIRNIGGAIEQLYHGTYNKEKWDQTNALDRCSENKETIKLFLRWQVTYIQEKMDELDKYKKFLNNLQEEFLKSLKLDLKRFLKETESSSDSVHDETSYSANSTPESNESEKPSQRFKAGGSLEAGDADEPPTS